MQEQVHLGEQIRQGLCLTAEDALVLEDTPLLHRMHLFGQMLKCLH